MGRGVPRVRRLALRWSAMLALWVVVGSLLWVQGCRKKGDSVVLAGDGSRLDSAEIDRDPLALLPSDPVAVFHVDVRKAVQSHLGANISKLFRRFMPLGKNANFEPQRDVDRVVGGIYTLQGVDTAMVLQGRFDPDAIRSAAETGSSGGNRLTRLEYAGNDLYVIGDVGFVVVTRHTMVAGNETGIRRVLDRIRDKHLVREMPDWMAKSMDEPKASVVLVGDLSGNTMVRSAAKQAPFLEELAVVRILGNFQPPGINVAGTLTYPDQAKANRAGQALKNMSNLVVYTNLLAMVGIAPPIQKIEVQTTGQNVQFVASIDANSLTQLLDWMLR